MYAFYRIKRTVKYEKNRGRFVAWLCIVIGNVCKLCRRYKDCAKFKSTNISVNSVII